MNEYVVYYLRDKMWKIVLEDVWMDIFTIAWIKGYVVCYLR